MGSEKALKPVSRYELTHLGSKDVFLLANVFLSLFMSACRGLDPSLLGWKHLKGVLWEMINSMGFQAINSWAAKCVCFCNPMGVGVMLYHVRIYHMKRTMDFVSSALLGCFSPLKWLSHRCGNMFTSKWHFNLFVSSPGPLEGFPVGSTRSFPTLGSIFLCCRRVSWNV